MKAWCWAILAVGLLIAVIAAACAVTEQNAADSTSLIARVHGFDGYYDHLYDAEEWQGLTILGTVIAIVGVMLGLVVDGEGRPARRINTMCLLGALLGFLCLAVPCQTITLFNAAQSLSSWSRIGTIEFHQSMTSAQFLGFGWNYNLPQLVGFAFAPVAFFLGVALAFVTPLGGVSMALGMFDYYWLLSPRFNITPYIFEGRGATFSFHWGAAFYVGVLATIVVLVSSILPLGPGYSEMYNPWPFNGWHLKERLLVWGRSKKS